MQPSLSMLPQQAVQQQLQAQVKQAQLSAHHTHTDASTSGVPEGVKEFGSLLVLQLLQSMRRTVPQSGLLGKGLANDTYLSLFDQEIARQVTQRDTFGLSALFEGQMTAGAKQTTPPPGKDLEAYRQHALPSTSSSMPPGAGDDAQFVLPVKGSISSPFGWRLHPIDQVRKHHHGIDIAAPAGTPVQAAAPGEVVFSGTRRGYGNLVVIQHEEGYTSLYAHNTENLVAVGDVVQQGQAIATVGQTGRATGPHLHFEIRRDGQPIDPDPWLDRDVPSSSHI